MPASIDGVLRGLLRDGMPVEKGLKIADIDPRISEQSNCFTISDKARTIAGGVLQGDFDERRCGIMKKIPVEQAVGVSTLP